MVGVLLADGTWLVYHAMTPPSKKTLREIENARRERLLMEYRLANGSVITDGDIERECAEYESGSWEGAW